jgi:hypothetical protein
VDAILEAIGYAEEELPSEILDAATKSATRTPKSAVHP